MAMLGSATDAVPKRKRPQVAPAPAPEVPKRKKPQVAPAPAPEVPKRKRPQVAPAPTPTPVPIVKPLLNKKEREAAFEMEWKEIAKKKKEGQEAINKIAFMGKKPEKQMVKDMEDIEDDADDARLLARSGRNIDYFRKWLNISKNVKLYGKQYLTPSQTLQLANAIKSYTEQVFIKGTKLDFTWNPTEGKYV